MEIQNIFANEMVLLSSGIWLNPLIKVKAFSLTIIEEAGVIAYRSVKPDIEIFSWRIRDLKAEIRGVAGDIPVT